MASCEVPDATVADCMLSESSVTGSDTEVKSGVTTELYQSRYIVSWQTVHDRTKENKTDSGTEHSRTANI